MFSAILLHFLSFTTTHSALRIVFQYTYRGATFSLRFISDFLLFSFCFLQVPEGSRRFILIPAHWGGVCALFIWALLCCSFRFDSLRVWVPPTFVPSEHFLVHGQNIFGKKKPSQLSIFKLGLNSIFIFIPSQFLLSSRRLSRRVLRISRLSYLQSTLRGHSSHLLRFLLSVRRLFITFGKNISGQDPISRLGLDSFCAPNSFWVPSGDRRAPLTSQGPFM